MSWQPVTFGDRPALVRPLLAHRHHRAVMEVGREILQLDFLEVIYWREFPPRPCKRCKGRGYTEEDRPEPLMGGPEDGDLIPDECYLCDGEGTRVHRTLHAIDVADAIRMAPEHRERILTACERVIRDARKEAAKRLRAAAQMLDDGKQWVGGQEALWGPDSDRRETFAQYLGRTDRQISSTPDADDLKRFVEEVEEARAETEPPA